MLDAGVNMVYIAMYDEVDEGTAMYKITASASGTPVNGKFISLDQDGYILPTDWYLRLAAATSAILRGKVKNSVDIPASVLKERKNK